MALLSPSRSNRRRLARVVGLLAGLSLPGAVQVAAQAPAGDLAQQVKAAYLLNFTRYVEWPPAAFAGDEEPLRICVVDGSGFDRVVRETAEGRRSRGRQVRVLVPDTPTQAAGCHVAYVGGADAVVTRWMSALAGAPTLTVGEGPGFLGQGGAVAFVLVQETIRFEIDQRAVRRSGLQLSSRVLALATRLHGGEEAR